VDTPIEVRPRDLAAAPAPVLRPPAAPVPPADAGTEMPAAAVPAPPASVVGASAAASSPAVAAVATDAAPSATARVVAPEPPPRAAASPPPPEPQAAVAPASPLDDGARARALLEGGGAAAPGPSRFVVQVGAYSDPAALRDARQRVERLGFKTYTQVVETAAGKRTRVRIGPFASRQEADAAAARLKGAGMPANILAL
jgi:DedD protein